MSAASKIEWTDATWNPIVGCSIVSPGCTNCYAMRQAHRLAGNPKTPHYRGTTETVNGKPVWTGQVAAAPDRVWEQPLRWRKPRRVFVNSMGDLFHEDVDETSIDKAFAIMALCPQHVFQVLTKRPARMRDYFGHGGTCVPAGIRRQADRIMGEPSPAWTMPLPNVWLGVSAERQAEYCERGRDLYAATAARRFLSLEPLLGPIDFAAVGLPKLDWVIAGGESGPGARPAHPDWFRSIRDQCAAANVPFFFKQWGNWVAMSQTPVPETAPKPDHRKWLRSDGKTWPGRRADDVEREQRKTGDTSSTLMLRLPKVRAGRELDGRTHDAMPEPAP